jgi:hypothetical protein
VTGDAASTARFVFLDVCQFCRSNQQQANSIWPKLFGTTNGFCEGIGNHVFPAKSVDRVALTFRIECETNLFSMLGFVRTVLWSSKRLPAAVFAELVTIIFTSLPPVALIGVVLTAVGVLVAVSNNDAVIWALIALGVAVTAGRVLLILAYRRRVSLEGVQDPALWECQRHIESDPGQLRSAV